MKDALYIEDPFDDVVQNPLVALMRGAVRYTIEHPEIVWQVGTGAVNAVSAYLSHMNTAAIHVDTVAIHEDIVVIQGGLRDLNQRADDLQLLIELRLVLRVMWLSG